MDRLIIFILVLIAIPFVYWILRRRVFVSTGELGESFVAEYLEQLPDGYYIYNDVVLPTERGTTQIDHVVVSKYGVFVIETKNYRGVIYGNDKRDRWTQMIVTDVTFRRNPWKTYTYVTKSRFYNPVKQTNGHAYRVRQLLKKYPHLPVVPMVLFVGEADISNVESDSIVIYENRLLETIMQYKYEYLNDRGLSDVLSIFDFRNLREYVDNDAHVSNVQNVQQRYYNKLEQGICPKCGGNLVERTGKFGTFYGCSNYPKCKYTINPNSL